MPLAVMQNEAPDPVQIRLLSTQAVVLHTHTLARLIEQSRSGHGILPAGA